MASSPDIQSFIYLAKTFTDAFTSRLGPRNADDAGMTDLGPSSVEAPTRVAFDSVLAMMEIQAGNKEWPLKPEFKGT